VRKACAAHLHTEERQSSSAETSHSRLTECPRSSAPEIVIRDEFGFEVEVALRHGWWLYKQCKRTVTVSTCNGTGALWWFARHKTLDCVRSDNNVRICNRNMGWISHKTHLPPCHRGHSVRPPLSLDYITGLRTAVQGACPRVQRDKRPILFVLNKYASEWGGPPVNYIPFDSLTPLVDTFHILYHRPDRHAPPETNRKKTYTWPAESEWLLQNSRRVQLLPDTMDLRTQLCYMFQADAFVSSQGGASRLAAMFRQPVVVWHVRGSDNYNNIRAFSANERLLVTHNIHAVSNLLHRLLTPDRQATPPRLS
jgi:hypothetical protein